MSSWPSHPPGPSSVPKWLLHHFLVITVLLSVASTTDLCDTKSDFGNLIHTIGVIDNELWAIAKDKDWTVYKLVPYKMPNSTLDDSMIVSPGVSLESKWPQLVEAVKNATGKTDLDFTVENSVIINSSDFRSDVLAMKSINFSQNQYLVYDFRTHKSYGNTINFPNNHVLISTDEKDKAYILDDPGKIIQSAEMKNTSGSYVIITCDTPTNSICNLGSTDQPEVEFTNSTPDCKHMNWTVLKGVLYRSQYYFFASDKVYIFSDQANTTHTKLLTVKYADFLQCKQPTTMVPSTLTSASNVTNAPVTKAITYGNNTMTSTKASNTTLILILVGISIVILVGVAIVVYCFCVKKNKDKVVPGSESALSIMQPQSKATSSVGKLTSKAASQASPKDSKRAAPKQSRSQLNKKVAELKQKEKESDKDSYAAFLNMKIKSLDGFDLTPAKVPAAQPVASKNK